MLVLLSPKLHDHWVIVPLPSVDVSENCTLCPTIGYIDAKLKLATGRRVVEPPFPTTLYWAEVPSVVTTLIVIVDTG